MQTRQILAAVALTSLLLLTGVLNAQQASRLARHSRDLPPGYKKVEYPGWHWASPQGEIEPEEGFQRFFPETLTRIRGQLGARSKRPPLVLFASEREDFERVIRFYGGKAPRDTVLAIAFPIRGVMVIDGRRRYLGPVQQYTETITHEIVHLALGEGGSRVPRWYHEGLAQLWSAQPLSRDRRLELGRLAVREEMIPLAELSAFVSRNHQLDSVLYAQSLSAVTDFDQVYGQDLHGRLLSALRDGAEFAAAFEAVTGDTLRLAEQRWLDKTKRDYSLLQALWQVALGPWSLLAIILVIGYLMERRRRRLRLQRMHEEEAAAEKAERHATLGDSIHPLGEE
ncbi:MAG: hypothetical protein AAF581_19130 [Planctomycetota bacterium]